MGYFVVDDIEDLAYMLEEKLNDINFSSPYKTKKTPLILIRCKDIEERNSLLTEFIYLGYPLKGIASKNGLWIKLTETGVYFESFKSLFVECEKPSYDEIYVHKVTSPSHKLIKKLKDNNVSYKLIQTFCFYEEHKANMKKIEKAAEKTAAKAKVNNKNDGEKTKKEIPKVLEGLEVSDDLHSFTYNFGGDGEVGRIDFYSSDEIDVDKLEEIIRMCF